MINSNDQVFKLVERGGVYYDLSGLTPTTALAELVKAISLPPGLDGKRFLEAMIEREALMSTAIGNGIALPHPRSPLISSSIHQFVAIGFLRQPIDWLALDGQAVQSLILIASSSPKHHLYTLSRISFLCQNPAFRELLSQRASYETLVAMIATIEQAWR